MVYKKPGGLKISIHDVNYDVTVSLWGAQVDEWNACVQRIMNNLERVQLLFSVGLKWLVISFEWFRKV